MNQPWPERIPKSLAVQERARKRIPGMTQLLSKRPDRFSLGVWPGYFSHAKGAEVWDLDENCYLDMSFAGIGANVLGYCDPDVDDAVRRAIERGTSTSLNCPEEVDLADLLCELHPWADMARFARSGGEAMAIAVRVARVATGRDEIAFCGYHGWHDWYLAANIGTENALGEHLIAGLDPTGVPNGLRGTAHPFRYNQPEELTQIVDERGDRLAAIVMEPIRNMPPDPVFLRNAREQANRCGAVLLVDEISSGFRMNTGGAHLELGLDPDLAVFSKALGNGYPISAVIGREAVMEAAQGSFISSTSWTERVGPVAAIAMIEKHRRVNAGAHLMEIGRGVQAAWRRVLGSTGLEYSVADGLPPLSSHSINHPESKKIKALYIQKMLEQGILATTSFYSMYSHAAEHVERFEAAAGEAYAAAARALESGRLDEELLGEPAAGGFTRLT